MQVAEYSIIFSTFILFSKNSPRYCSATFFSDMPLFRWFLQFIFLELKFAELCVNVVCDFSLALWSVENPYRFKFQSYLFAECVHRICFALLFADLYSFIYYEISTDRAAEGVLSKHFISTSISPSHLCTLLFDLSIFIISFLNVSEI